MADEEYQSFMQMPIEDLTFHASGFGTGSLIEKAKLVYGQRMMKQQHEYNKEQIEIQHIKNIELLKKQLRWMKFSAILTAISTLTAAITGTCLTYILTRPPQLPPKQVETQEIVQPQTKPSTLVPHSEQKVYKAPSSQPPNKDERQK